MPIIRDCQIDMPAEPARVRFIAELVCDARTKLPGVVERIDARDLPSRVALAVARAEAYGLTNQHSVWRYLHLVLECGDVGTMELPQQWARCILARQDFDENLKIMNLWRSYRASVAAD